MTYELPSALADGQGFFWQRLQPNLCKNIPYRFSGTRAKALRKFTLFSLAKAESFSKRPSAKADGNSYKTIFNCHVL